MVITFSISILISMAALFVGGSGTVKNAITVQNNIYKPSAGSQAELYKDMFVTILSPYIDQEIKKYYGKPYAVALFDIDFLDITRPNGYRSFIFKVKVKVHPFTGPHIDVGEDHITFIISSGEVKVEKFEHIRSYQLPPHLQ